MSEILKAPFPYFGGKRAAAPLVWSLLGDVGGYVEPFSGSAAVLLARPPVTGRRVETINDADGLLINTWRAIKYAPEALTAELSPVVAEVDYHAKRAFLKPLAGEMVSRLEGDPRWFDVELAAWWLECMAAGIGSPWDNGPWHRVQDEMGVWRFMKPGAGGGLCRESMSLSRAAQGVNGAGIKRGIVHLGDAGKGMNAQGRALAGYMHRLAARLQHVRIMCGDWARAVTPSVIRATATKPHTGIFLDPPYTVGNDLYATTGQGLDAQVREWCKTADPELRIVIAGYDDDHDELLHHGWTKHIGKGTGGGGYSKQHKGATARERLWASPACITEATLFDMIDGGEK